MPSGRSAQRAQQTTLPVAAVRRLVDEACNAGNLGILDELGAPPYLRQQLAAFRIAVPDARWIIVEQIADGDRVMVRLAVQGTFSGPIVGLASPGRPATLTGVVILRFVARQLVDLWLQADLLSLLQQLRVMPPLALDRAVAVARVLHAATRLANGPESLPSYGPCIPDHEDIPAPDHQKTQSYEHCPEKGNYHVQGNLPWGANTPLAPD